MEKYSVLAKKNFDELLSTLLGLKKDIFSIRISNNKSIKLRSMKKQVARIKTIINSQKIKSAAKK